MKQEMVQSRNRPLKSSNSLVRGHLQNSKVLSRIMTVIKRGKVAGKKLFFHAFIYQMLLYILFLFKSWLEGKCPCEQKDKVSLTGFFLSPLLPLSGQWMMSTIAGSISVAQSSFRHSSVVPPFGGSFLHSKEGAKRCCMQLYINPNFWKLSLAHKFSFV